MQNAPQEFELVFEPLQEGLKIPGDLGAVKKRYREQRKRVEQQGEEKNTRNSNGSQSGKESRRFAQSPAWEPLGTMSTDDGQESNTEKQECSQLPERRKRTRRQCLLVVAELALAVSTALAGVLALAEWNKHKELAKFRNGKGHYEEHGKRIDVKKERHWGDRKTLTTAAQSILRDQSALSLATDPAERRILEERIQSNRELAETVLQNVHPYTRRIAGAPDGNVETLLKNQDLKNLENALKELAGGG